MRILMLIVASAALLLAGCDKAPPKPPKPVVVTGQ